MTKRESELTAALLALLAACDKNDYQSPAMRAAWKDAIRLVGEPERKAK
jgi:hypothetical protein